MYNMYKAHCFVQINLKLIGAGLAMYNDSCVGALSICLYEQRPLPLQKPMQQSPSSLQNPPLPEQNSDPPEGTHWKFGPLPVPVQPEAALQSPLLSPVQVGVGPGPGGGGDGVGPGPPVD